MRLSRDRWWWSGVKWSVVVVEGGGREDSACLYYVRFRPLRSVCIVPVSWIVECESEDGVEEGTYEVRLIEWLGVV